MKIKKCGINLYDTLFSGQCFRMNEESDGSFTIVLSDRVISVREDGEYLYADSNKLEDLESVVTKYFDLNRDYDRINDFLCSKSDVIKKNIHLCQGYRILNQDKFEMFITYIISQNNNVKRIMGSVSKLCHAYGDKVIFRGKDYYLFPNYDKLRNISKEELRSFGVGFRDLYIMDALRTLDRDPEFLDKLENMSTEEALSELVKIKGIGTKVASCILLFGYGRFDTFPIDTWVRQFVSSNYNIKNDIKTISKNMKDLFLDYSGIAIQYFYHIERNKKGK